MIVSLLLVVPTLLATWFCYWFMGSFGPLWNRASRITSLVCPLLVAIFLSTLAEALELNANATDLLALSETHVHIRGGVLGGIVLALTFVLILPTLAFAFFAGNLAKSKTIPLESQGINTRIKSR
jgi:hypothetical protein